MMIRPTAGALLAIALAALLVSQPEDATAEADGPDWFRVTGVAANDVLNVREQAGARHRKVGELPPDANGIRNLGCVGGLSYDEWSRATAAERAAAARQRWCRVAWRGIEGWVAGRFLAEGSAPAAGGGNAGGGGIAVRDMERYCRGEASAAFGVRPPRIRTRPPERRPNGAHAVFGDYDGRGNRVSRFECRFGPRGGFRWVRETGSGGSAARPPSGAEPETGTERIRFPGGSTGTEITRSLAPGASTRFVLGARSGQELYVRVSARRGSLDYQIFNPDRSFLQDMVSASREYRGQLWQGGDHVIEVINRGNATVTYNLIVGIN